MSWKFLDVLLSALVVHTQYPLRLWGGGFDAGQKLVATPTASYLRLANLTCKQTLSGGKEWLSLPRKTSYCAETTHSEEQIVVGGS